MKREFEMPVIELVILGNEDIIKTSDLLVRYDGDDGCVDGSGFFG